MPFSGAFNATYTAEVGDWGITAVSLRSPDIRDKLKPQENVYTATSLGPEGMQPKVIEVLNDVLVAPENPLAVLKAMSNPQVAIVSLTITEKGYCHNPATGALQMDHPDNNARPCEPCRHLYQQPDFSFTPWRFAVQMARLPFTVLSCDNLPDNGALAKRVVLEFARHLDPSLADWIDEHARFPATMVDRITPATTVADIAALEKLTGFHDPACVMHEPFRQWVIEDNFCRWCAAKLGRGWRTVCPGCY